MERGGGVTKTQRIPKGSSAWVSKPPRLREEASKRGREKQMLN